MRYRNRCDRKEKQVFSYHVRGQGMAPLGTTLQRNTVGSPPSAKQTERAQQALQKWLAGVIEERAVKMLRGTEND